MRFLCCPSLELPAILLIFGQFTNLRCRIRRLVKEEESKEQSRHGRRSHRHQPELLILDRFAS